MLYLPPVRALKLSTLVFYAFVPTLALSQTSFSAHSLYNSSNVLQMAGHGDFNNDGREDLMVFDQTSGQNPAGLLFLSNGDGTYDAPKTIAGLIISSSTAIGDFNRDGNLDYAAVDLNRTRIDIFLGHGDGTFTQSSFTIPAPSGVGWLAAGDLNHDNKTDLVVTDTNNGVSYIQIWLSNGDGTFNNTQTITSGLINGDFGAFISDFDGDGKADLGMTDAGNQGPTTVQIWYGDGAGHLGSPYKLTDPNGDDDRFDVAISPIGDFNNDGKADFLFYRTKYGLSGTSAFYPQIAVFSGNSNRTVTFSTVNTTNCPVGINVADFNGDGLNDLAYSEVPCSNYGGGPYDLVIRPATSSGVFGGEQTVYSNAYYSGGDTFTLKSTRGTKPDLAFTRWTAQQTSPSSLPPMQVVLLSNTTSGAFPGCGTIAMGEGIHLCTPSGTSASSPVRFSISASGPTPMRTVAVWADGRKVAEQLPHAFSNYSFLDQSVSLIAGSHSITIYGTGWDNTLQQKSFTLNVAAGSTCPADPGYDVHVCSPISGTTVSSPVHALATAHITGTLARMEVWVDGVKKFTETSSLTLNTSIALGAGKHRFDFYAVNTSGTKWETTVYATVP